MTQSRNHSAVEWLRSAIDQALARGVTRSAIYTMVATAPPPALAWSSAADANAAWPSDPDRIVYDEVPAGLITLPDAAAKYGVKRGRLNVAVFRGMIPRAGRLRGPGQRGGKHLVPEHALRRYLGLDAEPTSDDAGPTAQPRASDDDLPLYDELPEGMITLPNAARKYGAPADRIRWWIRAERLTRMGYLRGGSPQGGYVLLVEAELAALLGEGLAAAPQIVYYSY